MRKTYEKSVARLIPTIKEECRKRGHLFTSTSVELVAQTARTPTPGDVKEVQQKIKKFFHSAQKRLRIPKEAYLAIWSIEPGDKGVHAIGRFIGPHLPATLQRELAELGGSSARFSIRSAGHGVSAGLRDVFPVSVDAEPESRAALEAASKGIRLVHTMGSLYGPKPLVATEEQRCPICGAALMPCGDWVGLAQLASEEIQELSYVRRTRRAAGLGCVGP
jgi:hypothetical protein